MLLAALCLVASARAGVDDDALRNRTAQVVLDARASHGATAIDTFAASLDALLPAANAYAFELLGEGGVPAGWGDAEQFVPIDAALAAGLHDALLRTGDDSLRTLLARVAKSEERVSHRTAGIDLVAEFGRGRDVDLLLDLARPLNDTVRVLPRALRKRFEQALVYVLARDARAFASVESSFGGAHAGLHSTIADAVARFGTLQSLETLVAMLGRSKGVDAHVLTAIARCAPNLERPIDSHIRNDIRSFLFHVDEELVDEATDALARLEDYDALPTLIARFVDADAEHAARIQRALVELTGLHLPNSPQVWSRWYEGERAWIDEELPDAVAAIRMGSEIEAIGAVSAFAGRRLERHALASALHEALDRREASVARMACLALAELGSSSSIPPLVAAMEDPNGSVRNAAWAALRTITGRTLPQDAALWRASISATPHE